MTQIRCFRVKIFVTSRTGIEKRAREMFGLHMVSNICDRSVFVLITECTVTKVVFSSDVGIKLFIVVEKLKT